MLHNLEVSEKVLVLAPEYPLVCKILGSVVKEQLRKINPARVRYTEFKPPKGGFIFNELTMDKKKVIVYVDGYNFYYGLKNGFAPEHPIHVFVPPTQNTYALASKCDNVVWLEHFKARFAQSMLPEEVVLPNGHKLTRPGNWK